MTRAALAGLFALWVLPLPAGSPAGEGKPASPEAKASALVRAYVLNRADDPDSVKFAKVGPHDPKGKLGITGKDITELSLGALPGDDFKHLGTDRREVGARLIRVEELAGGEDRPLPLARARYRLKNRQGAYELHDTVFVVWEGEVFPVGRNRFGDRWGAELLAAKKALREFREGAKRDRDKRPRGKGGFPDAPPPY